MNETLGSSDTMKFRSRTTWFAAPQPQPFEDALRKYHNGMSAPMTPEVLHAA